MGLLLSIFVSCVGVVELFAAYANVRRKICNPAYRRRAVTARDALIADVTKTYFDGLLRERKRLQREIARLEGLEDFKPEDRKPRQQNGGCTELGANGSCHQEIYGDREPSPYPTFEVLTPRNSICPELDDSGVLEVNENDVQVEEVPDDEVLRAHVLRQESILEECYLNVGRSKRPGNDCRSRSRTPEILRDNLLEFERRQREEAREELAARNERTTLRKDEFRKSQSPFQQVLEKSESEMDDAESLALGRDVLNSVDGLIAKEDGPNKLSGKSGYRHKKKRRKERGGGGGPEDHLTSDSDSAICETSSDSASTGQLRRRVPEPGAGPDQPFWVKDY